MNYRNLFVVALLFVVAGLTAAGADEPQSITVAMHALNRSTEDGTAILTQEANGVQITIELQNAPDDEQPTHIHVGTCENINKSPEYSLSSTVKGKVTSIVHGVTLADLLKGHYAINVHKSAMDLGTYVSCGNIR